MVPQGRGIVSPARVRALQLLLEAREQWAAGTHLAHITGTSPSNMNSVLVLMLADGWVEKQVDDDIQRRRGGALGRKPRSMWRITDLGKTALIESMLSGD